MKLKNKVVVITGASRGLGKALAIAFFKEGANLVLSSRPSQDLKEITKAIKGISIATDVKKEKQIIRLANTTIKKFGKIDIWINNAGIRIPAANVLKVDPDRIRKMIDVNFWGTFFGSREAYRQMKKQKSGTIVNILSTSALKGNPYRSGYAASKCAAHGFTQSLRAEVEKDNISVIGVYPRGMKTNFFDEQKPRDFANYMNPDCVAQQIVSNLKKSKPAEEIMINKDRA